VLLLAFIGYRTTLSELHGDADPNDKMETLNDKFDGFKGCICTREWEKIKPSVKIAGRESTIKSVESTKIFLTGLFIWNLW
jgi:hypothetical protein